MISDHYLKTEDKFVKKIVDFVNLLFVSTVINGFIQVFSMKD